MKIVFFGNGDFSINPLKSLLKSQHKVVAIVSDSPRIIQKRGSYIFNTPLSIYAKKKHLNLIQFDNINDNSNINVLKKLNADIFIVVEFKKIRKSIFTIPPNGTINIHASLLPSYRGAAPIQRSIMNGDKKVGITSFFINEVIDSGDIIDNIEIDIDDKITYGECYDLLSISSKAFIINTLKIINNKNYQIKESIMPVSYAKKIKENDRRINFNQTSYKIHNLIRALYPNPQAYAMINNKRIKLIDTYYSIEQNIKLGEHVFLNEKLHIGCRKGTLIVNKIQFENKKIISARDFNNIINLRNINFE